MYPHLPPLMKDWNTPAPKVHSRHQRETWVWSPLTDLMIDQSNRTSLLSIIQQSNCLTSCVYLLISLISKFLDDRKRYGLSFSQPKTSLGAFVYFNIFQCKNGQLRNWQYLSRPKYFCSPKYLCLPKYFCQLKGCCAAQISAPTKKDLSLNLLCPMFWPLIAFSLRSIEPHLVQA